MGKDRKRLGYAQVFKENSLVLNIVSLECIIRALQKSKAVRNHPACVLNTIKTKETKEYD